MTQEDKNLLLKDIYARLPYGGVTCGTKSSNYKPVFYATIGNSTYLLRYIEHDELKPYLRPMSSMTMEEKEKYRIECNRVLSMPFKINGPYPIADWLNAHYFDHRGLIEKGLALEAPEDMYKTE